MSIGLHQLQSSPGAIRRAKRIGRGNASGHGTYSTRGQKGQRARSGGRRGLKRLGMKRIIASLPKSRGFLSHKPRAYAVQLSAVVAAFGTQALVITVDRLKAKGLAPHDAPRVKIIGGGKTTGLNVKGIPVSASTRAAIEAAGGHVA